MAPLVPLVASLLAFAGPSFVSGHGTRHQQLALLAETNGISVVGAHEECYVPINVARTAKLEKYPPPVTYDKSLEEKAIALLKEKAPKKNDNNKTCEELNKPTKELPGFVLQAGGGGNGAAKPPNCADGVFSVVKEGLQSLKDKYSTPYKYEGNDGYATNSTTLNFGSLFYNESVKYGCAKTIDCKDTKDILYCRFEKELAAETVPITKEVFEGLEKRKVDLATLTASDIQGLHNSAVAAGLAVPAALALASIFSL